MRELTYAQALREALIEEMDRDPNIILLGEDIGVYGGVFKVTDGLLARYGPERVRETPVHGLHLGGCRSSVQPGCQDALHVRWPGSGANGHPYPTGGWPGKWRSALSESGKYLYAYPWLEGGAAGYAIRCEGAAEGGISGSKPCGMYRA